MPASTAVVPVTAAIGPDELIGLLERGAACGIHLFRILLALGFRPAAPPAAAFGGQTSYSEATEGIRRDVGLGR